MDVLIDRIMNDSDVKSKYSHASTSSVTSDGESGMSELFDKVSNKEINMLEVVVGLERYHTEGTPEQRAKAINILFGIIHEVADIGLDSKAVAGLAEFLAKKYKDVHCVLSALRGINALLKYHPLIVKQSQRDGDRCLSIIVSSLAPTNIHIPAYNQKVRSEALRCLETLLNNYTEFFKLQDLKRDDMEVDGDSSVKIPYVDIIS